MTSCPIIARSWLATIEDALEDVATSRGWLAGTVSVRACIVGYSVRVVWVGREGLRREVEFVCAPTVDVCAETVGRVF